jgi:hypothetical protein
VTRLITRNFDDLARFVMNIGMMSKDLHRELEFIVEVPKKDDVDPRPIPFSINPKSLENVKDSAVTNIPDFSVKGRLSNTNCPITLPFTGEITVHNILYAISDNFLYFPCTFHSVYMLWFGP